MKVQTLTVATVTLIASWSSRKLVHVKSPAVTHFDILSFSAALILSVEANCSRLNSIFDSWMIPIQPAGLVSATVFPFDTFVRHRYTCVSSKPVPSVFESKDIIVALLILLILRSFERFGTIG